MAARLLEPLRSGPSPCETAGMEPTGPTQVPTADQVRAQLDRMLASPQFAGSSRLSRFLRFVVSSALAGDAGRLKEYAIGIEVFDRNASYDPRVDSIVRVEAGRLRGKIEEYYHGTGSGDPVRIRLEKGSYAPAFELRVAAAPAQRGVRREALLATTLVLAVVAAVVWRVEGGRARAPAPAIAVLPFAPYAAEPTQDALALRLTEAVTAELVRDGSLGVVPSSRAAQFRASNVSPIETAQALGARVLLQARLVVEGERVRLEARLVDGGLERKFWVDTFVGDTHDVDELARRVAAAAAHAAADELDGQ